MKITFYDIREHESRFSLKTRKKKKERTRAVNERMVEAIAMFMEYKTETPYTKYIKIT